jgi:hypothetical protein
MLDFESLRIKYPNWAFPVGLPIMVFEFDTSSGESICVPTDSNGELIGPAPDSAISVRRKYITIWSSISGHTTESIRYEPRLGLPPLIIGVLLSKEETLRAVQCDESKKEIAICDASHFIFTPAACVIQYNTKLPLIDPKEFGYVLDLPSSSA